MTDNQPSKRQFRTFQGIFKYSNGRNLDPDELLPRLQSLLLYEILKYLAKQKKNKRNNTNKNIPLKETQRKQSYTLINRKSQCNQFEQYRDTNPTPLKCTQIKRPPKQTEIYHVVYNVSYTTLPCFNTLLRLVLAIGVIRAMIRSCMRAMR